MAEDLAVRLNALDAQRAVEQTAILMSLFSEASTAEQAPKASRHALASLLGYMSHLWCRGVILHREPQDAAETGRVWQDYDGEKGADGRVGQAPAGPGPEDWDLDFVVAQLDGARSFMDGRDSGSISVIAGGRQGTFVEESDQLADSYLALVVSPDRAREFRNVLLRLEKGQNKPPSKQASPTLRVDPKKKFGNEQWLGALLLGDDPIEFLRRLVPYLLALPRLQVVRSWATSTNQPRDYAFRKIRKVLQEHSKVRTFSGSSVSAATSVLFPRFGIDLYVGAIRRVHTILLAAACEATGGEILAVPIKDRMAGGKKEADYALLADKPVLLRQHLIPNARDLFITASALAEGPLLHGIRYHGNAVRTHTFCLRSRTRSSRFTTHHHNLTEKRFRFLPDGFLMKELLQDIKVNLGLDLRSNLDGEDG